MGRGLSSTHSEPWESATHRYFDALGLRALQPTSCSSRLLLDGKGFVDGSATRKYACSHSVSVSAGRGGLRALAQVIEPVNGVDISPIVWFAVISFFNEILLGPQGLLILLSQKVN